MINNIWVILEWLSYIIYVIFLPGFLLSYIFIKSNEIDLIDRISLSCALSIVSITLIIFYLDLLGIKFSKKHVIYEVLFVVLTFSIILTIKFLINKTSKK
jgi:uncharacterized membrane protein